MDKIRAVIADDEPVARRGIRQLLQLHKDVEVVGEARNGLEAVRLIRKLKPDLLFIDVQMPAVDGFDVLRHVHGTNMPAVIFITAYDQFAVRAFDAHALDYLVKPVKEARFAEALERTRERFRLTRAVEVSQTLMARLATQRKERARRQILVPTSTGELVLKSEEIEWIEAEDYYAAVYARGRRHLIRESLASLEQRLNDAWFVRVHRSAIVNLDRVREVRSCEGETLLVLYDGVHVPVSRRRRKQVATLLRRHNH